MLAIHFLAYLVMYLSREDPDLRSRLAAFYCAQVVFFLCYTIFSHMIYRNISRILVNNSCMLLCAGLIMLTRLSLDAGMERAIRQFAIAAVLSIIVMYDAMGVRYETGEQAKLLNRMFSEWMDQGAASFPFLGGKKLKEMVGHTPIEVLTGAVLGVVLGFAMPMV